ncbi:universal stress protein [Streptomyces lydicus]|uniref:universal stress protein n=1 Tax=Streptomyces lydicus TaxID=47763 RepID=UPI0037B3A646
MKDVVTAGVDGTPEAHSAVLWAAQEAWLRQARLQLLHARVLLADEPEPRGPEEGDRNYWPHRMMEEARDAVRSHYPDLPVDTDLVPKDPFEALKEAAGESDLLVLGSRNLGPMTRYVLGELGLKLVAHTDTPTVLVRAQQGAPPTGHNGDVVVGVALHEPCEALLAFAFESAARRGVTLRAVHGRHLPAHAYNRGGGVEPYAAEEAKKLASDALEAALAPWREKYPDLPVDARVEMESPAPALLHDTTGAALLAVGRRRRHLLRMPRIGHVVQAVVHHAPCPVAVVPHE